MSLRRLGQIIYESVLDVSDACITLVICCHSDWHCIAYTKSELCLIVRSYIWKCIWILVISKSLLRGSRLLAKILL